jgi:hypothetical protein
MSKRAKKYHIIPGLAPVIELVTTVLWSGQVADERPLSLILVASPGTGKTSVLEMLECATAKFFSDFTSREIMQVLKDKPQLTHLMLGDFLAVFGHAKGTVKLSINLLSRLTGDNVNLMPWSGEEIKPRRMGFLTAIPPDDLNKREIRSHVRSGGFASRFIIAKYRYSRKAIENGHKYIREGKYRDRKPYRVDIETGSFKVNVPKAIAVKLEALSRGLQHEQVGFREHHHIRTLACSIARMNSRNTVTEADYEKVVELADFFTEQGHTI